MTKNEREKIINSYTSLLIFNVNDKKNLNQERQSYYEGRQTEIENIMTMLGIRYKEIRDEIIEDYTNLDQQVDDFLGRI